MMGRGWAGRKLGKVLVVMVLLLSTRGIAKVLFLYKFLENMFLGCILHRSPTVGLLTASIGEVGGLNSDVDRKPVSRVPFCHRFLCLAKSPPTR
jgi:hypothetical protein